MVKFLVSKVFNKYLQFKMACVNSWQTVGSFDRTMIKVFLEIILITAIMLIAGTLIVGKANVNETINTFNNTWYVLNKYPIGITTNSVKQMCI